VFLEGTDYNNNLYAMYYKNLSKAILLLFFLGSCLNQSSENYKWKSLFDGKDLTGWNTYLGPKYDTILNKWDTIPTGLNIDPAKVFSVIEMGGEKVMRISGEQFGGISTIMEFENYHLQLQFKWGQLKWPPSKKGKKDSGLMYYAVGPQGADGGFWMRSHEFQIEEGDCGDYWACAGAVFDVMAKKENDSTYVYNKDGDIFIFSTVSPNGRNCQKYPDAEKPSGEWNTIDLYCYGSTSVHIVNGVVNMILHNSRQLEGNKEIPLTKGKIQFESEGAEIFYRNIKICSIDKIPDNILDVKKPAK
jgi:Domain of Unknown Function (DUF1080)